MSDTAIAETPAKKKIVRRKSALPKEDIVSVLSPASKDITLISHTFTDLQNKINQTQEDFENLLKEIVNLKEAWTKEQKDYETKISERDQQEAITRQRENETYKYETVLARQKDQDAFQMKKTQWERELAEKKEELAAEKEELYALRKQVAGFEAEKEKTVKEASLQLQKTLTEKFEIERKMREQEVRAEKEILNLKINNLSLENTKQAKEIENLKRALEEATKQVKDIAVKVIEGRTPAIPSASSQ